MPPKPSHTKEAAAAAAAQQTNEGTAATASPASLKVVLKRAKQTSPATAEGKANLPPLRKAPLKKEGGGGAAHPALAQAAKGGAASADARPAAGPSNELEMLSLQELELKRKLLSESLRGCELQVCVAWAVTGTRLPCTHVHGR